MNRWRTAFFVLLAATALAFSAMIATRPARVEPATLNVRIMQKCVAVPQRTWRTEYQFTEAL